MIFWPKKGTQKLTAAEKERLKRIKRNVKPSTQNSLKYNSLYENGTMHIAKDLWSKTYKMGDVAYTSAPDEGKLDIIDRYAEGLNAFEAGNYFQLLLINRRVKTDTLGQILYQPAEDGYNEIRKEYNDMIRDRFSIDKKNFKVEKYVTITTDTQERSVAENQLYEIGQSLESELSEVDVTLSPLRGLERMEIFSELLRFNPYIPYDYEDVKLSNFRTKDFVAPNRLHFMEDYFKIDNRFGKVMFIRNYPSFLTDKLIKKIMDEGIELALTIHAEPYEPGEITEQLKNEQATAKMEMIKNQREAAKHGIDPELAVSGVAQASSDTAGEWEEAMTDKDMKIFNGVIAVYVTGDDYEEMQLNASKVKTAGRRLGVTFEDCFYYQEDALNTMLPIGYPFLDVKDDFMRPFTTANLATQVPFTNVDLQSESPRALYYGQNQLSNNVITLDRQRDLNAPNGFVIGSSGSGKSTTVKTNEIVPTYLKYTEDKIMIVDPEDEYSDIGLYFGAEMVKIGTNSNTHLNLLDLPDTDETLYDEHGNVIDLIADKANLLVGLLESILQEVTDAQTSIIDRVTRLVYERHDKPTLKEWQAILKEQPEEEAQDLAKSTEIYTTGSLNIFAHETNVDLSDRMVIFNLKGLSNKLKPFALKVVQDYIWNQVIQYQGILTIRLFWDEIHQSFRTQNDAVFFAELWARIRKYGAIPTGITQNIGTLTSKEEGRNMLSNSEFMVLLKHKPQDMESLRLVLDVPPALEKYITKPKGKGSGLIVAGQTIVPFENKIPSHTKLYQMVSTDPYTGETKTS
ncbi:VirB4-like conjugal transfer ATPase, CD1110 family [Streptococcus dentiloxodontae]